MSEVLRSFFSYQVAVGRTMSEYMQVVDMRKSSVTRRSSFPSGASSCQTTSLGFFLPVSPRSLPITPCVVPSRCFRKYSWPLPEEPSRLERQTKRLRGQFFGLSGSSQESLSSPDFRALRDIVLRLQARCGGLLGDVERDWPRAAAPTAASPCARRAHCSRSARRPMARPAPSAREFPIRRASRSATGRCGHRRRRSSSSAAAGGPSRGAKASGSQPVCGRSFSWPT